MKVTCPKCRKVVQAPDEWAGRKVKCPGCKDMIKLPLSADGSSAEDLNFDLGRLGSLEAGGEILVREHKGKPLSLKEAQQMAAQVADRPPPEPTDPTIRICPKCGQKVRCLDPYAEVMCSYCSTGITGRSDESTRKAKYIQDDSLLKKPVSFYDGFTSAAAYPLPALGSIGVGMALAFASITAPLLAVLGFLAAANANPITQKPGGTDYGWVGLFITSMFIAQAAYFGSVAYCILIDTIRTTNSGTETPPNLIWNIIKFGSTLGGYAILVVLYVGVVAILLIASNGTLPFLGPTGTKWSDFAALGQPGNLVILTLLTFCIPMNLIGLASGHPFYGLNPLRFGLSIGKTIGHYIFLFLIFVLYVGIYAGIMTAVLSWAGPAILQTAREGLKAGLANMIGGLGAWAVVLGAGFYFAYSIGRILGLFSRTYNKSLNFES